MVYRQENSENFLIGGFRPNSAPNGPEPTGRLRRGVHMARAYGRMVPRRAVRAVGPEPGWPDRDLPEHSWNNPEGAQPNPDSSGPDPIGRRRSVHMGVYMAGRCRIVRMGRAYGRKVPMRAHAFSGA